MRARYAIPAAGALLLVALALAGAAHQVAAWHNVILQDDVRFVTTPAAPRLWAAPRGPGAGFTRDLLGTRGRHPVPEGGAAVHPRARDCDELRAGEGTPLGACGRRRSARGDDRPRYLVVAAGQGGEPARNPAVRGLAGGAGGVAGSEPSGAPRVRRWGRARTRERTTRASTSSSCSRSCGRAAVSGAICARTSTGLRAVSGQGSLFRRSAIEHRARDSLGRARRAHSRGAGRGMGHRGAALGLGTALNRARATATSRQRAPPGCARVGDRTARARRGSARRRVTAPVGSEAGRRRVRRARHLAVDARVTRARDPDEVRPRESDRPSVGQGAPGRGRRDRLHDRSGPAAPLSDRESSRLRRHAQRRDRRSATASCRGHAGERHRPRLTRRTCPGALLPAGRACACRRCPDRRRVPRGSRSNPWRPLCDGPGSSSC